MPDSTYVRSANIINYTAVAACTAGQIVQLADGRAAQVIDAIAAGALGAVQISGIIKLTKTADIALLPGGRVYWDDSASKAHFKTVDDRDFYLGTASLDALEADTVCYVDLNKEPRREIMLQRDAFLSVPTGTKAAGAFGYPKNLGGSQMLELTATSEAQSIDLLAVGKFSKSARSITEFVLRASTVGSGSACDTNFGIANGTHTTDFESVTEAVVFHLDGGALTINAQSRDGTTTVAVVTTTISITEGLATANKFEFWIDARNNEDVELYINGVKVLAASVFKINAATGPFAPVFNLEKTTGTETARWFVDRMESRLGGE